MLDLLLAGAVTCVGSLILGQGVLALCGARAWSWLAAPVGVAVMILLAVPAIHLPGRSAAVAVVTGLLILAGLTMMILRPLQRPPLGGLVAALPVAVLVLVPFAASGRAGTLGVSFDNDMGEHLLLAEAYRSAAVSLVTPLLNDYPLGPHALVAMLAEGLGIRTDLAFAGFTAAVPVLLAWTALTAVRGRWLARVTVATLVGIPFLIAAYYGQGSFKELLQAVFVLAVALILAGLQPQLAWRRWIPFALICAGAVSVYSLQGLVWPAALLVVWVLARALTRTWKGSLRSAWVELRGELLPGALGLGVLVIVLIPQIPRIEKFISKGANNAIGKSSLGNLVGPLPGWEGFGVWDNPDYQLPPLSPFGGGMWIAFTFGLVVLGACILLRRGRWMLPFAAAMAILIWAYTAQTQSPYVAAKALVIASPLLLLLAGLGVVERGIGEQSWWRLLAPLLAIALLVRVLDSSWEALRFSKVGPTEHLVELRSLRPLVGKQSVLYLGDDDFIYWELSGVHVTPAYYAGTPEVPLRPEKAFAYGQALDFDSVSAATLDQFDWVIAMRDAAGSEPPAGMRLVRLTPSYALYRRVAEIQPRSLLPEGENAAALLDCHTAAGRATLRAGRVAAVRPFTSGVEVPPLVPGASATVSLSLPAGKWALETPYLSPLALKVSAPGLHATLPANLERPGPRWPIGTITLTRKQLVKVTFHVEKPWLAPLSDVATPGLLLATLLGAERTVPIRQACGQQVDWYGAR